MNLINENLLDAFDDGYDAIFHVANCQKTMNSGVAKALRGKWPEVYQADLDFNTESAEVRLGKISKAPVQDKIVFNLYGQLRYGYNGARYLNYEAFYMGLERILSEMQFKCQTKLACAYKTGCDRAGGDWGIVEAMIDHTFKESGILVSAYKF